MFDNMMNDRLIAALKPQIEKAIEPMFLEMRAVMLTKMSGPPPESFRDKARDLFEFSDADVKFLWEAACDAVV